MRCIYITLIYGRYLAVALLGVLLLSSAATAATTGGVRGFVKDAAGKPLGGVHVVITELKQNTTTGADGSYSFSGIAPGTYTLHAGSAIFTDTSTTVTVLQDVVSEIDFALSKKTIKTGTSKIYGPQVRNDPLTQYTLTPQIEQQTKSQPNNLYQFPGLIFGQPGITPDDTDYMHIRGSDVNQVGYSIDGVPTRDPLTNQFATDLVTVGLQSANLYTGTADPSYGNATGGFVNEVTQNGRDIRGGIAEMTVGPFNGWGYLGTNDQYGNVTADGKLDYYLSSIDFATSFPQNTQTQSSPGSFDALGKVNYYMDPNDTITGFYNQGYSSYDYYDPYNPANTYRFEPTANGSNQYSSTDTGTVQTDGEEQQYDFGYLSFKHIFNPNSFITFRSYKIDSAATFHIENIGGEYEQRSTSTQGNQIDYTNQMTRSYQLRAGVSYTPGTTFYHSVESLTGPPLLPIDQIPSSGDNDRYSMVKPTQSVVYLANKLDLDQNKVTLEAGARAAEMQYELVDMPALNDSYVDPRLAASYLANRDLVFRTSYGINSEFPDSQYIQYLFPEEIGQPATATDPTAQLEQMESLYRQYNPLKPEHSNNFDLGAQKAFNALGSPWTASLTGYDRYQYDLIQEEFPTDNPPGGARYYDNAGHGHASGAEFILTKRAVDQTDWHGFLSYTNQVATATNSFFDTDYVPYFFAAYAGDDLFTNQQFQEYDNKEFPTSYDQRHTIALVATKKYTKRLESSLVVDAGSGFPYENTLDYVGEGSDSQHTEETMGTATFTEVPITLPNQTTLTPLNPAIGRTGWHYKLTLNTNLYLTKSTNLFFNIDNLLDAATVLNYATTTQAGQPYYLPPTAQYPQGRIYYGPSAVITPTFISMGVRMKF